MRISTFGWLFLASMTFFGCTTKEMKSTPFYEGNDVRYVGDVSDRVNLWPLAYYREPVGSVLWPVVSWADDHFAIRPLYSKYGSEHNIAWPIISYNADRNSGRVFPIFLGPDHFVIFPILFNYRSWGNTKHVLFPIIWWTEGESITIFPIAHHSSQKDYLFPLYYNDSKSLMVTPLYGREKKELGLEWALPFYVRSIGGNRFHSLLWSQEKKGDGDSSWCAPMLLSGGGVKADETYAGFLLGLGGYTSKKDFRSSWIFPLYYENSDGVFATSLFGWNKKSNWVTPLYYKDEDVFASLPWIHRYENDHLKAWSVPPLLTGAAEKPQGEGWEFRTLLGLAGARWGGDKNVKSQWLFPLFYNDNKGSFITPIYGQYDTSRWMFPLYYEDGVEVITPLFGYDKYSGSHWFFPIYTYTKEKDAEFIRPKFFSLAYIRDDDTHIILPLLSGWCEGGKRGKVLLGFAGWDHASWWVFPLFGYDAEKGDVATFFYGRESHYKSVEHWWLLPIFRTKSGLSTGLNIFPLVDYNHDSEVEKFEEMMNAAKLDESIMGEEDESTKEFIVESRCAYSSMKWLLGLGTQYKRWVGYRQKSEFGYVASPANRIEEYSINAREHDRTIRFYDRNSCKNMFFANESCREVNFDYDTKEKLWEGEADESRVLGGLLWNYEREYVEGKRDYEEESLLWRLWHYEKQDGNATTDIFPFITVDEKANGYFKSSFFWRFFRYENDPEKGKKLDFLFLPILRKTYL